VNQSYWLNTYEDIRDGAAEYVVVQPIGSTEQHGPHLPVGTDSLITTSIIEKLEASLARERLPICFLPLLPYGKSNEHDNFPGTISLSLETLISVLRDVGRGCARAGFRKLIILNGHGGNHETIDLMTREIRIQTGMGVFAVHPFLKIQPQSGMNLSSEEAKFGIHAGEVETSLLLRIRPDAVKTEAFKPEYPSLIARTREIDFSERVPFGWVTEDVSTLGTIGDPTRASRESGESLLDGICASLVAVIREICSIQWKSGR
jgi:creatinine amidohydrolase